MSLSSSSLHLLHLHLFFNLPPSLILNIMGKQWLLYKHHATATGKSSSSTSTKRKSRKTPTPAGDNKHQPPLPSSSSTFGCMTAIFHLFDIQHHHLPFHQPSFISIDQEPNTILKPGLEAPRNSLELDEQQPMPDEEPASSSSKLQQESNFSIPMHEIQNIKTKRSRLTEADHISSSDCSSTSPAGSITKTPNLVARLMGLDLLPDQNSSSPRPSSSSPRVSSSSSHATPLNPLLKLTSSHKYDTTRSLPATPRISTACRPSTEATYHHRLSLQINKENNYKRRYDDESTSEYAKQIAKQVRENISRRVGADITNSVKNNDHRRDEFLVVLKPKRSTSPSSAVAVGKSRNLDQGHEYGKENEPIHISSSPKLRLLEIKHNIYKPDSNSPKSSPLSSSSEAMKASSSSSSTTKSSPPLEVQVVVKQEKTIKVQKCKRIASEKYDLRLKKMNQQEEQFVKKCNKKSTPLSNHLVKVNNTTKFISFNKDMESPSSAAAISTQKQGSLGRITQLPSCQSRSYNKKVTHKLTTQDEFSINGNGVTTTTTTGSSISDHFQYISRILSHTGIEKTTPISISNWYSPSHPLHPSIFQQIEKHHRLTATTSTDRKLIFDVTDELLVEILKPYISFKPWASLGPRNSNRMCGTELIRKLCEKIGCFPAADCQLLEDIDGLIEGDMRRSTRVVGTTAFEEEAEELVAEMERDMVDTLVNEMAVIILHVGCGSKV